MKITISVLLLAALFIGYLLFIYWKKTGVGIISNELDESSIFDTLTSSEGDSIPFIKVKPYLKRSDGEEVTLRPNEKPYSFRLTYNDFTFMGHYLNNKKLSTNRLKSLPLQYISGEVSEGIDISVHTCEEKSFIHFPFQLTSKYRQGKLVWFVFDIKKMN